MHRQVPGASAGAIFTTCSPLDLKIRKEIHTSFRSVSTIRYQLFGAKRLGTHEIICLDNGEIVARGTYQDLCDHHSELEAVSRVLLARNADGTIADHSKKKAGKVNNSEVESPSAAVAIVADEGKSKVKKEIVAKTRKAETKQVGAMKNNVIFQFIRAVGRPYFYLCVGITFAAYIGK